jgi:hypothetical protein
MLFGFGNNAPSFVFTKPGFVRQSRVFQSGSRLELRDRLVLHRCPVRQKLPYWKLV